MSHIVAISSNPDGLDALRAAILDRRAEARWSAVASVDEALGDHDAGPADVVLFDGVDDGIVPRLSRLWSSAPLTGIVLYDASADDGVAHTASGALTWVGTDADPTNVGDAVDAILERRDGVKRLDAMTLDDVVTLAVATAWTGGIAVRNGARSGRLGFAGGRPAVARFADLVGEDALIEMLTLPGGTLVLVGPVDDADAAIEHFDLIAVRDAAEARRRDMDHAEPVDITDEDLELFMGTPGEPAAPAGGGDAFQLFSDDELAELQLDDAMAVSLPRPDGRPATRPAIPTLRPAPTTDVVAHVHLDAEGRPLGNAPGGADAALMRALAALGRAFGHGPGAFARASADLGDARFAAVGTRTAGDIRALIDTQGRWTVELYDLLLQDTPESDE